MPDVPAIELRDIVKRFPGVVANDGVNLTVMPGTIHAIVGENGAGKSTLMKTLYGAHHPDEGSVIVNGTEQHFRSPRDAIDLGIGMVFQHFMLADNLTVWENVVLGDEPGTLGHLDRRGAVRKVRDAAAMFGLRVNPRAVIADLGVGERQRVEILKVLYRGARIIILDEPTAVLVPQEVDELFVALKGLAADGVTIIFISHKLDEVLAVADAITVIRAGRTVAEVEPGKVTARELAELMVGSELPTPETRESTVTDQVMLELDGIRITEEGREILTDVSVTIRKGEIVGIAGVEGNGQTELIEAILGIVAIDAGRIRLEGADITSVGTRGRRELGVGYIPEDRHRDGIVLGAPLWENVALGHQTRPPAARGPWIDRKGVRARTEEIVEQFDVRTPDIDVAASALSGGNQQKLIVGREMLADPTVLIAAHPTRGIDVGAQAAVWESMRQARKLGLAVLLVSADLDELIGLADTLLVILRGRIVAELDPATVTPAELGSYMTGAREDPGGVTKRIIYALAAPVLAAIVALTVASIALLVSGHNPFTAFEAMISYLDSAESVVAVINRAVPYYVAGLAVALGFKMGLFNIGADGQYRLAALLAAAAGAAVTLPAPIHVAFILVVAMAVGGAYAAIAGVLKVTRGVNEVVSTIMLNYIATGVTAFLLFNYLQDDSATNLSQTKPLPPSGQIPSLNRFLEVFGYHLPTGTVLFGFLPFAILLGVLFYVVVNRSRFGFDLRVTGANPAAALSSGVNPKAMVLKTIVLSGMIAGLIGMGPLLADPGLHLYGDIFPTALGFTGIAVALLGRNSPGGIAIAALVWAGIERGSQALNTVGVPQEIGRIMQGSLLLSAVIAFEVVHRYAEAAQVRDAAARLHAEARRRPPTPAEAEAGAR